VELESALRSNQLPGELEDAAICRFMGWGWLDLCAAPAQLVEDIRCWMGKGGAIEEERMRLMRGMRR